MDKGWVVVFDLDDTIYMHNSKRINKHALEVINKAVEKKGDTVSAIFLLTNNSDGKFIREIVQDLEGELGAEVFDDILSAEEKFRGIRNLENKRQPLNYATKSLKDIEYMCVKIGIPTENLIKRVLFFDDQQHKLMTELSNAGVIKNYAWVSKEHSGDWEKGDFLNSKPSFSGGRHIKKRKSYRYRKSSKKRSRRVMRVQRFRL